LANKMVNLCIYVTPRGGVELIDIENDVKRASLIWEKCSIEFNIKKLFTPIEKRELADFLFVDKEITHCGDIAAVPQTPVITKLRNMLSFRPECEETDVAVYYVDGNTFSDGVTNSCFYLQQVNGKKQFSIVLTHGAINSDQLAHELGHALFVRQPNGNFDDPDPKRDPADPIHNTDQCFLMHTPVTGIKISQPQCKLANDSILLKDALPPADFFRLLKIKGSLLIIDYDWPDLSDFGLFDIPDKELKVNPFKIVNTWEFSHVKDEVRIEVTLKFYWSMDSSITLQSFLTLYDDNDPEGWESSSAYIPKDAKNFKVTTKVINEAEDDTDESGDLVLWITNEIDPNP
jgi:hypothetical protein